MQLFHPYGRKPKNHPWAASGCSSNQSHLATKWPFILFFFKLCFRQTARREYKRERPVARNKGAYRTASARAFAVGFFCMPNVCVCAMENYHLMRASQIFIAPPGLHFWRPRTYSHYFIYYSISRFNVLAQRLCPALAQQLLFHSVSDSPGSSSALPTFLHTKSGRCRARAAVSHVSAK
jgi:hypothetical protein